MPAPTGDHEGGEIFVSTRHEGRQPGMQVRMHRIAGVTPPGILTDGPFIFQSAPLDEFHEVFNWSHDEFETISFGQRSRFASRELREFTFTMLAWDTAMTPYGLRGPHWQHRQVRNPITFKEHLANIGNSGAVFRLTAGNTTLWGQFDVDTPSTLRSMDVGQRAGEPESLYFTLAYKEWRPMRVRSRIAKRGSGNTPNVGVLETQLLQGADRTLYGIAGQAYGSPSMWRRIAEVDSDLSDVPPSADLREWFADRPDKKIFIPSAPNYQPLEDVDVASQGTALFDDPGQDER